MKHYHLITSATAVTPLPPVGGEKGMAQAFSKIAYTHPLICFKAEDDEKAKAIASATVPAHIPFMLVEVIEGGEGEKVYVKDIRLVRRHWVAVAN